MNSWLIILGLRSLEEYPHSLTWASVLQLHTVKEGSDFAPRPLPEFEFYESTETTNPVIQEFTQSLLNLKNEVCFYLSRTVWLPCLIIFFVLKFFWTVNLR